MIDWASSIELVKAIDDLEERQAACRKRWRRIRSDIYRKAELARQQREASDWTKQLRPLRSSDLQPWR
jgi:hypothetical protein